MDSPEHGKNLYHLESTLPETNVAPTNGWLEYDPFLLGRPIFRGYVSFREGRWHNSHVLTVLVYHGPLQFATELGSGVASHLLSLRCNLMVLPPSFWCIKKPLVNNWGKDVTTVTSHHDLSCQPSTHIIQIWQDLCNN